MDGEGFSFMAPFHSTRLFNSEVLGSKFPTKVGVIFREGDVNAVAVGAVTADGGETPNTINEDRMWVGEFSR